MVCGLVLRPAEEWRGYASTTPGAVFRKGRMMADSTDGREEGIRFKSPDPDDGEWVWPSYDTPKPQERWRPVDRLPADDCIVLVYVPEEDHPEGCHEPVWLGYFSADDCTWRYVTGSTCHPTHWMPLPDPPA